MSMERSMTDMVTQIQKLCTTLGIAEVGFFHSPTAVYGLTNGITLIAKLSNAVVDSITDRPTHLYFHHYRTVNTYLDQCALRVGQLLDSNGYRYIPVAASQTVDSVQKTGLFSHKMGAVLSGLGRIGKNALFLSSKYGPRIRLATVFTDCDLSSGYRPAITSGCGNCRECVKRCPAMALSGDEFCLEQPNRQLVDVQQCSDYMKREFQLIGRGAVCGICMRHCPAGIKPSDGNC